VQPLSDVQQSQAVAKRRHPNILRRGWTGAVEGNARLTATTGIVLLVLLFVEGMTLLSIRGLFTVHAFVGLLLIPPILLKMASTGYRFVQYYTGNRRYRESGPPQIILRIIAPFLVVATVVLFATGVILIALGPPSQDSWRTLHTLSFLAWFALMTVHVLAYLGRAPRLALADLRPAHTSGPQGATAGIVTRQSLVAGSILLGLVVAIVAIPWEASWVNWLSAFHGGH
jgi:hypothetical protein